MKEVKLKITLNKWSAWNLNRRLKKICRNAEGACMAIEKCQKRIEKASLELNKLAESELLFDIDEMPIVSNRGGF